MKGKFNIKAIIINVYFYIDCSENTVICNNYYKKKNICFFSRNFIKLKILFLNN